MHSLAQTYSRDVKPTAHRPHAAHQIVLCGPLQHLIMYIYYKTLQNKVACVPNILIFTHAACEPVYRNRCGT